MYLREGYTKNFEVTCLLVDKKESLFIGILDDGNAELRLSDKDPFGMPFDNIEDGELFKFIRWTKPGSMVMQVVPCVVSEYTKISNNRKAMKSIDDHMKSVIEGYDFFAELPKKIESLRDKKIENIIK